jgi:hypothetical protein
VEEQEEEIHRLSKYTIVYRRSRQVRKHGTLHSAAAASATPALHRAR